MSAPTLQVLTGSTYATNITSQVLGEVKVTRGRQDEFGEVQPSTLEFTLDISDSTPTLSIGLPIRVAATANAVTTNRFTGTITAMRTGWGRGSTAMSTMTVTAVDSLAALSRRRLSGVLTQAVTTLAPDIYYPLDEPEGATSCGDRTGHGWPTLALAQRGAGGTFSLGGGTGPATEPSTSATFERASATAGPYLTASYTAEQLRLFSTTFAFVVSSSTVAAQSWIRLRRPDIESSDGTPLLEIGCTAAGYLQIKSAYRAGFTAAGTVNICDGLPHLILVVCNEYPGGFGIAGAFNVMAGVDSDTLSLTANDTSSSDRVPSIFRIDLGGSASTGSNMASASISRLMLWGRELSAGERSSLVAAATTGFITDSTNGRIQRIATWAGITNLALETGSVTSVAHQDTTGLSPIAAMQAVAATERGLVFINGSGQLVFHARSHRDAPTWTALVDANALNEDVTFTTDTQALINKATVSRPAGAAQTFLDSASIAAYDEYATDAELLFTNDTDAYDAAAWLVNTHGTPAPRISTVTLDLLTQTAAITQQLQALELGSLIGITGLPSQAPSGGLSLFVEGWSESISVDAWEMVLNTSPLDSALVLDSDWYDQLDYWRLG
jgi:hypothetical protein